MANHYDLTVVGAGFAGLACAQAATHRGLKTLVIDRKPAAGVNMHTTGIIVKELADEWDIPTRLTRKIHGVRLYSPGGRHIDLHRPGYYFLATNLRALMQWWSLRTTMIDVDVQYDRPLGQVTRHSEGIRLDNPAAESRFLIGADGARSAVAQACGLQQNRKFLVGVEAEFTGVRGLDEDVLHVFIDSHLAPGYIAWVVPGVGQTQVGLAAQQGRPIRLDQLIQRAAGLFDFSQAKEVERRGGWIPINGPLQRVGDDRTLLIGDAAGVVSPLTAGGIHTAICYGRYAGVAVCDYLMDGGPLPVDAMMSRIPRYHFKKLLRKAYDLNCPNILYDQMIASRLLRAISQAVFFHNRGLFSWTTWRDVLNRLQEAPVANG